MPTRPLLPFRDREEAGHALAAALASELSPSDTGWVLALPRGGVPVACPVAAALGWPLDVLTVRKLGVPGQAEYAMGAIATGGFRVLNDEVLDRLAIRPAELESVTQTEAAELARREALYRGNRPAPDVRGRTVVVVDDGLATGATMRAAVKVLRAQSPARVVVAVPVAAADAAERLAGEADRVVALATPHPFMAVGRWYRHFPPVDDDEVRRLLSTGGGT
jgi:putative phosphoribosyl transferase